MRRVFAIEVLTCLHCQGPRRLLAAIFDPDAIGKVLQSLGVPAEPPVIAKARPPPQARMCGLGVGEVPEVVGFDFDGVPFRLSGYPGKVVVLDSWGDR